MSMLTDPENPYEEWEADVWAPNLATAQAMCERIALNSELTEVINVTQSSRKLSKTGKHKFLCWFKTELSNDDSSNN